MSERLHRVNPVVRYRARQLRRQMTHAERLLWARLRDRRLDGLRVRRQHPIEPYIADFYCASARLVIEIDGNSHSVNEEYDLQRTRWLKENGYRVMRLTNSDVMSNIDAVMEAIRAECLMHSV